MVRVLLRASREASPSSYPWGYSHVYADNGTYPLTLTVSGGASGSDAAALATVSNARAYTVRKSTARVPDG